MCLCSRESSVVSVCLSVLICLCLCQGGGPLRAVSWVCRRVGQDDIDVICIFATRVYTAEGEAVLCGARWPGRIDMTAE